MIIRRTSTSRWNISIVPREYQKPLGLTQPRPEPPTMRSVNTPAEAEANG
jgi:hypothetical protein